MSLLLNKYAKFGEDAHNGLVWFLSGSQGQILTHTDSLKEETTAVLLYLFHNALRGDE